MILRRKKKQKKLKEAQQQAALLASLQQQGGAPLPPVYTNLKRPPSAMSVPIMSYHEADYEDSHEDMGSGGSDPDVEALIDPSYAAGNPPPLDTMMQYQYQQQSSSGEHPTAVNTAHQQPLLPALQQPVHDIGVQGLMQSTTVEYSLPAGLPSSGQQHSVPAPMGQHHAPPLLQQQSQPVLPYPASLSGPVHMPPTQSSKEQARKVSQPVYSLHEQQQLAAAAQLPVVPVTTGAVEVAQTVQLQSTRLNGNTGTIGKRSRVAHEAKKIPPEKMELISAAVTLGLGRGIDATNKTPWLNKTSFQVRRIHTSVIETNEGGIMVNYSHEVQSVAEVEEKLTASLNPPESTVTICIEDELDRNVSSSRRIVGRRIINRSISFQADFEEKYKDGEMMKIGKDLLLVPKDPAEIVYNTQESGQTFEERLSLWLLHRLGHKCNVTLHKTDESPIEQLAKLIQSKAGSNFEKEIQTGCQDLVKSLRVTHYITGIQLGAAEYQIMSDGQYHKKMATTGAFGVDTLATAPHDSSTNKTKQKKKDLMKCSQMRQLGLIEENHVAKGSHGEVVLQVQVQPITRLIKLPALKLALRLAVEKYMEGTPTSEGGPFVIKCTGRDLYLTVNKFNNYEVEATDIPTEASLFYFQTTDDGGNPFEFHIAYYGEDVDPNDQTTTTTEQSTIGRYLEAPLSAQGRCPGPLLMKHSVKVKNTRFTLRSRLSKKNNKSHLAEWIAGEDAFYIACATKKYQHGSYLAVKNIKNTGDLIGKHFFMTYCDPSIHNHNGDSTMMLFQLCTKESLLSKGYGRETPGKMPLLQPAAATEIDTRK